MRGLVIVLSCSLFSHSAPYILSHQAANLVSSSIALLPSSPVFQPVRRLSPQPFIPSSHQIISSPWKLRRLESSAILPFSRLTLKSSSAEGHGFDPLKPQALQPPTTSSSQSLSSPVPQSLRVDVSLADEFAGEADLQKAVEQDALQLLLKALNSDNREDFEEAAELSIVLCSDEEILRLNDEWRGTASDSSMLAFPQEDEEGEVLGDLVMSLDTARREANDCAHSLQSELRLLMVRGLLQLLGYHSSTPDEALEMEQAEQRVLKRLGWPSREDLAAHHLAQLEETVLADPSNGASLHELAKALVSTPTHSSELKPPQLDEEALGVWRRGEELWLQATQLAPEHPEISEKKDRFESYYPFPLGGSFKEPFLREEVEYEELRLGKAGSSAFVSTNPVLGKEECLAIIEAAESRADEEGGWFSARNYSVPTTDMHVHRVPAALHILNKALSTRIFPMLSQQYGLKADRFRVFDAFIVKYSAAAQRELPLHTDQSLISATLALNAPSEFEGGGTWLEDIQRAVSPEMGCCVSFPGSAAHAGKTITKGQRCLASPQSPSVPHHDQTPSLSALQPQPFGLSAPHPSSYSTAQLLSPANP